MKEKTKRKIGEKCWRSSYRMNIWFVRKSYCQFLFNFPDSCVHMLVPQVNACWHILFSFNFLILNSTNYPDPVVTRIIYELQNLEPKECQDEDITSIWLQRNIEEIPVLKLFQQIIYPNFQMVSGQLLLLFSQIIFWSSLVSQVH